MALGSAAGAVSPEWIGRAPHEQLERGARPVLPSKDPFFTPPAGFEHAEPGTVLRSRDVELGFLGLIPQKVKATQLLYRTTDLNGLPLATVPPSVALRYCGTRMICQVWRPRFVARLPCS